MLYDAFSLNGSWEMGYLENEVSGTAEPSFSGCVIPEAVPGYWEDMVDAFANAPFCSRLKINPEYGIQRYPMSVGAPDMALPNITGTFLYRRSFLTEETEGAWELAFSGVQNRAAAWLNGTYLGSHEGYSTPFSLPIPKEALHQGENTLVIRVCNLPLEGYDGELVSGLTNRAANQYTGGITGDLELRRFKGNLRGASVLVSEDLTAVSVRVEAEGTTAFRWEVLEGKAPVKEGQAQGDFTFCAQGLEFWTPEQPRLYTLRLREGDAVLELPLGIRRLTSKGSGLFLNGAPVYLRGICEHCYFPETVHPSHDSRFYRRVIRKIKELGFNFIRFHTYIPEEEYMEAADKLGILLEVESPNNTSLAEFRQITEFCRKHPSVVMYSCGNELHIDGPFLEHLRCCAEAVHQNTDSLFSPMSALRGAEYFWTRDPDRLTAWGDPPRHPEKLRALSGFSDVFNSFTMSMNSYDSLTVKPEVIDSWYSLYNRPRLSHEICIQGTYTDLSLAKRYEGTRVGNTEMFSSIEKHLRSKGLLHKAPTYFENSSHWQRLLRKFCFESTRLSQTLAGYDFLGPIDTHWHTFGYDVGMMNEFYELKPGETVRNVRMYNGPTVLLTDLGADFVFSAGEALEFDLFTSHFGPEDLREAKLRIRLTLEGKLLEQRDLLIPCVETGKLSKLCHFSRALPQVGTPGAMKLYVTLEAGDTLVENEWDLYLFPEPEEDTGDLIISRGMSAGELKDALREGKDVVLLGAEPFQSLPTSFQMSLAGRTNGNLATVIADHPALEGLPNDGYCGWQFRRLMEGGSAVSFECDAVPFDPIIDLASSHKCAIRQALLFEFRAMEGRLLCCGLNFSDTDPAARWLKAQLIHYALSKDFNPAHTLTEQQLDALLQARLIKAAANKNLAFNQNDKAAQRKNRKEASK